MQRPHQVLLRAGIAVIGALVTRGNVGIFQRVYALTIFVWIGVAAGALLRRWPG